MVMHPELVKGAWYKVDGPGGVEWIPGDVVDGWVRLFEADGEDHRVPRKLRPYCRNEECWSVERVTGYGVRLSAPGYLDCTEWAVFDTKAEAEEHLADLEGDGDDY